MAYSSTRGRKPYERASKIAHTDIINDPDVVSFVEKCTLPSAPSYDLIENRLIDIPDVASDLSTVIAIDGGLTETFVREQFPSASIAFVAIGPLLLRLDDLRDVDLMTFIGPDDMARLKNIQRYSFAFPTRGVRYGSGMTFAEGVRTRFQEFLLAGTGELMAALRWFLHRGWLPAAERQEWKIPQCPNRSCDAEGATFRSGDPDQVDCASCGRPIYAADAFRFYERIEEEHGASGILSYALTGLEQIVLVHLIKSVLEMKPALLKEILFVKDGPLAFFGVTAPLRKPMRELMTFLANHNEGALINLVGLEKSGAFVEHASAIEDQLDPNQALVLDSEYIYKYVMPGDSSSGEFGGNTYYGRKVIFKGGSNDMYVGTVPMGSGTGLSALVNGAQVLRATTALRCSMYDNALIPVALANKLVSLADVPSAEILRKFAESSMR